MAGTYTYATQLLRGRARSTPARSRRSHRRRIGRSEPDDDNADAVFGDWAARLKALGIRSVAGRVIGDDNAFDDNGLGFGWSWDDLPDDYAAGVSALQFNENAVRVIVTPGPAAGDSAGVSSRARRQRPRRRQRGDDRHAPARAVSLTTRRLPGSMRLAIGGSMPAGRAAATLVVSVDNPTLFFASALRLSLAAHGIDVRGPAIDVDDVPDATAQRGLPIATHIVAAAVGARRPLDENQPEPLRAKRF